MACVQGFEVFGGVEGHAEAAHSAPADMDSVGKAHPVVSQLRLVRDERAAAQRADHGKKN
jgi:hypothetical protein